MPLAASCPRCTAPLRPDPDGRGQVTCSLHGRTEPLWRPDRADYDTFAELVGRVEDLPTYLPWPLSPGWSIADFGCVGATRVCATVTTTVGASDLDGEVEVTVVAEDPGVGLGARCAGTAYGDPGPQHGQGPPAVHVRAGGRAVPLWLVEEPEPAPGRGAERGRSAVGAEEVLARAVFAGEADGRWLWVVMRPASSALLLHDEWQLADVTGFGPEALDLPFGGPRPTW